MRAVLSRLAVSLFAASLIIGSAVPARADDFGKRITLDLSPTYDFATTGDANAPPPLGESGVGYTRDNPIPEDLRLNYGADVVISKKQHFYYTHETLDFAIGRVLTAIPKAALVSGEIADRTDTIGTNYNFGHGLVGRAYYFDHQRSDVTGLCLNQIACSSATGAQINNPASIDEHGYGIGFSYNFGPLTEIGPLFTAGFDAHYIPRSSTEVAPNLGGLGKYVGTQTIYPYSLTMKLPIVKSHTLIPFIGAEHATVLFRGEATPEVYTLIDYGIVKVISKNFDINLTNLNFSGCRCADTVPPPDNIRFAELLLRLDMKTQL